VTLVETHPWIRRALAARFPRLFLDEYQDLAPGLDRLAQALCFDETADADLFAVGDPDQSIMGFNGSRPELLLDLANRPRVHCVRLETNYRNRASIVQTALRALGEHREIAWLDEGGDIEFHECPNGREEQHQRMLDVVIDERDAGTPLEEVAVLCPNRWVKGDVVAALRGADIPAIARGEEYRETPTTTLLEAAAAWSTQPRGASGFRLGDLLRRWRILMGPRDTLSRETALVRLFLNHGDGTGRAGEFAAGIYGLGLAARLHRTGRDDEADELDKMVEALTEGPLRDLTVAQLGARAHAPGQVHVSTMHAGKGLEFDAVVLIALDEGDFPSYHATSARELEDARRTFYVSLTRARRRVDLIYSGFRTTAAGARRYDGPSRFLADIS
jgi:DNA helicase-2/ATP-dependent DNA helicase PcrA